MGSRYVPATPLGGPLPQRVYGEGASPAVILDCLSPRGCCRVPEGRVSAICGRSSRTVLVPEGSRGAERRRGASGLQSRAFCSRGGRSPGKPRGALEPEGAQRELLPEALGLRKRTPRVASRSRLARAWLLCPHAPVWRARLGLRYEGEGGFCEGDRDSSPLFCSEETRA